MLLARVTQKLLNSYTKLVENISVAHVQPRTPKGITDLLLTKSCSCYKHKVPLRNRSDKCMTSIVLAG